MRQEKSNLVRRFLREDLDESRWHMQDEINTKVVALVIRVATKAGQLTERELKAAINKYEQREEHRRNVRQQKKANRQYQPKHGKQTVGELMEQNQGLTNIEITNQNIKSFERIANKYNIDFALKKDKNSEIPKYIVFFKARDVDVMTAAFKEYTAKELNKSKKQSIKKKLNKSAQKSKQQEQKRDRNRQRQKHRNRGREL